MVVLLVSCQRTYDLATKFTPGQLRDDFLVLRRSLYEAHPGLYRHTNRNELDRLFLEAEQSLDRPLDVVEFHRMLAPLVASVRCGHTNIDMPDFFVRDQDSSGVRSFPALIKIVGGKIYIRRDLTNKNNSLGGKEILSINKVPAPQIVTTMLAAAGGDGNIRTSRIKRIEGWNFIKKLMPLTGLRSPFELTVSDPNSGSVVQIRLDGIGIPTLGQNWENWFPQDRRPPHAGGLEFIDGGNIARMTIREFGGFVDDDQKRGLAEFYRDAFRQIAANGTKVLVLDLRDNGGGDDRLGTLLLSYLLDRPFVHYRDIVARDTSFSFDNRIQLPYKTEQRGDNLHHVVDYPNLGVLQPSGPTFSGKIYVLMDGGSFSTAAEVITQLHNHGRAEFIGEEAGGAYDGNNADTIARVTLPNTQLTLLVPLMSYYLSVGGGEDNSRGVKPNYSVEYSISDYMTNADRGMAVALERARLN
jgi:hypothetical protein